jgi:tRNA pseudouridine38-40 synthase
LRQPILTTAAGRTDAGVHAAGQVASFDAVTTVEPEWLQRRLNRAMAPEISVKGAAVVPTSFDARFSAKRRVYEYAIHGGPAPDPFLSRTSWWVPEPLDVAAMSAAAAHLVGEHDFSSFCRAKQERSLVRRIRSVRVTGPREDRVLIRVVGDSFCHQMVRSITGLLVAIGKGERAASDMKRALGARSRSGAPSIAPARGLTLVRVVYRPDPFRLAQTLT